jgi:hypothetical protein
MVALFRARTEVCGEGAANNTRGARAQAGRECAPQNNVAPTDKVSVPHCELAYKPVACGKIENFCT